MSSHLFSLSADGDSRVPSLSQHVGFPGLHRYKPPMIFPLLRNVCRRGAIPLFFVAGFSRFVMHALPLEIMRQKPRSWPEPHFYARGSLVEANPGRLVVTFSFGFLGVARVSGSIPGPDLQIFTFSLVLRPRVFCRCRLLFTTLRWSSFMFALGFLGALKSSLVILPPCRFCFSR